MYKRQVEDSDAGEIQKNALWFGRVNATALAGYSAVSYTHLDVYKRQGRKIAKVIGRDMY